MNAPEHVSCTIIEEVTEAVGSLNKGKAPDVYSITAENVIYEGDLLVEVLCAIFNAILHIQSIPDVLKSGIITPVYKNKGSKMDAKNYRGITVLPVIAEILELILRNRLQDAFLQQQNPMQRGFTSKSSPFFVH